MKKDEARVHQFVPNALYRDIKIIAAVQGTTIKAILIEGFKLAKEKYKKDLGRILSSC